MIRIAALLGVTGVAIISCILHLSACKDDGAHVFQGQLYVEARGCLGTPSTVDVIAGDEPGTCDPVCLLQRRADGGSAVYVATMCPPYPTVDFDATGGDPRCAPALEALARDDTCFSDGGSAQPVPSLPLGDAGAD